jgi:hypothetical protein
MMHTWKQRIVWCHENSGQSILTLDRIRWTLVAIFEKNRIIFWAIVPHWSTDFVRNRSRILMNVEEYCDTSERLIFCERTIRLNVVISHYDDCNLDFPASTAWKTRPEPNWTISASSALWTATYSSAVTPLKVTTIHDCDRRSLKKDQVDPVIVRMQISNNQKTHFPHNSTSRNQVLGTETVKVCPSLHELLLNFISHVSELWRGFECAERPTDWTFWEIRTVK